MTVTGSLPSASSIWGKKSAASILGAYDPDYRKNSLGFFTMLMEIQFCQQMSIPYYYPGYVVPGYSRFDYKLRIGPVSYFDLRQQEWLPYNQLREEDIPAQQDDEKVVGILSGTGPPAHSPQAVVLSAVRSKSLWLLESAVF